MKVSSASTVWFSPPSFPPAGYPGSLIANLMRWVMNQAVLYRTSNVRMTWWLETPFLLDTIIWTTCNHWFSGTWLSSNALFTFTMN